MHIFNCCTVFATYNLAFHLRNCKDFQNFSTGYKLNTTSRVTSKMYLDFDAFLDQSSFTGQLSTN